MSQICRYRLGEIEHTTLRVCVSGMRNVYYFVARLSACLEKHRQFQKLENIYNRKVVPGATVTSYLQHIQEL